MDTIKIPNKNGCRMIAHRGVSGIELENTVAAFVAAGNRSYFGIETDVHVTKDGQYVICHDCDLKRVGGVEISVEGSTLAELRAVQLHDLRDGSVRTDMVVPLLSDYIKVCRKYDKVAVLELKGNIIPTHIAGIVSVVRELGWFENTIFISFSYDNLLRLRAAEPEARAQLLPPENDPEKLLRFCLENRMDLDAPHAALTPEIVKAIHDAGLEVNCWTVDSVAAAERVIAMGVDYITTNILE